MHALRRGVIAVDRDPRDIFAQKYFLFNESICVNDKGIIQRNDELR